MTGAQTSKGMCMMLEKTPLLQLCMLVMQVWFDMICKYICNIPSRIFINLILPGGKDYGGKCQSVVDLMSETNTIDYNIMMLFTRVPELEI